jgi:uncharacterized protein YbcI
MTTRLDVPVVGFFPSLPRRSATPQRGTKEAVMTAPNIEHEGDLLSDMSNEMVALYKDQLGRGPTRARANWAGENAMVVTLEDSLTRPERRLVEMGEDARLRDQRTFSQYATIDDFVEVAERLTGRTVRAFVSGIDTQADVCSEVFYFDDVEA